MTLWFATLETRNFSFEGFGATHDSAWAVLVQGLRRHGQQYRLSADWFSELLGDIHVREVARGMAYRDGEKI